MRTHGTLVKWNDERGFGFVQPSVGIEEIFVHVSAFPRDGTRPSIGELISFEVELLNDGKKRAVRVMRPGAQVVPNRSRSIPPRTTRRSPLAALAAVLPLAAFGWYGYTQYQARFRDPPAAPAPVALQTYSRLAPPAQVFRCDGRTMCSQMTSCAEATYFLRQCPGTKMDGDLDGVPCETQWCSRESFD